MKRVLLGLAVLALLSADALAHGGAYRGPAGEVPPNLRKPEDPPPPPDNGTPTPPPSDTPPGPTPTPGDGGDPRPAPAPPPGSNPGDPGDGAGGIPGGAPAPGGTATKPGGRKAGGPKPLSYDSWEFWWAYNKDQILDLKEALRAIERTIKSGSSMSYFGRTSARNKGDTMTPTEEKIRTVVYPALLEALTAKHFDIQAGAAIALAKVASTQPSLQPTVAKELIRLMQNRKDDVHFSVQESGALALGLLQSKDETILNALCDMILDKRGKSRTRAFAALAVGLLQVGKDDAGYARVKETLREILKSDEANQDVEVCAMIGVGLMGDVEFVPELAEMVRSGRSGAKKLNDLDRSYAASALGKIAEAHPEIINDELMDVFKRAMQGKGQHTPRSAVIAFGQLGTAEGVDPALIEKMASTLMYAAKNLETQAQNFALISLGKIGGKTAETATRNRVFATLKKEMEKGSFTGKPFAAIALGLMGRGVSGEGSESVKATIRTAVRYEFANYKGAPTNRGAFALALGMLKDTESVDDLIKILEHRGNDKKLRGFTAIALGLIKDNRAGKAILAALEEKADRDLRVDTAVAAGLLGDSTAVEKLVTILNDKDASLFVQGSVSLALGAIGDSRAIDPLKEICLDEKVPDLNRALAAVALGNLGDRNEHAVLSRLSEDVNYRATVNSVVEVLSIL